MSTGSYQSFNWIIISGVNTVIFKGGGGDMLVENVQLQPLTTL